MGCDIHIAIEVRENNKWVPASHKLEKVVLEKGRRENPKSNSFHYEGVTLVDKEYGYWGRDYNFFAFIAGVRGRSPINLAPKGMPEDIHPKTRAFGTFKDYVEQFNEPWRWIEKMSNNDYGYHSHTWFTAAELYQLATLNSTPNFVPIYHGTRRSMLKCLKIVNMLLEMPKDNEDEYDYYDDESFYDLRDIRLLIAFDS